MEHLAQRQDQPQPHEVVRIAPASPTTSARPRALAYSPPITALVTTLNGEVWKITNVSKFKH